MGYTKLERVLTYALRIDSDIMRRKLIVLEKSEGLAYGLIQTLQIKNGIIQADIKSAIGITYTKNDLDLGFSYMVYSESDAPKELAYCPASILSRLTEPQTVEARMWRNSCLSHIDWKESRNILKANPLLLDATLIAKNTESHCIKSRF